MQKKSLRTNDFIDDVLEKYSNMVFRIAYSQTKNKADAEDVFQTVFIRLMKCNTEFESEQHLKAWLIRTTVNCGKSLLTSAWVRRTTGLADDATTEMPEVSEVYDTVMRLPAKYRIVIHLHYYEDMSISDMAKTLGKSVGTVKSQLHRAREILKTKLKGDTVYV